MLDEELRMLTASESLSLEEEYDMQSRFQSEVLGSFRRLIPFEREMAIGRRQTHIHYSLQRLNRFRGNLWSNPPNRSSTGRLTYGW